MRLALAVTALLLVSTTAGAAPCPCAQPTPKRVIHRRHVPPRPAIVVYEHDTVFVARPSVAPAPKPCPPPTTIVLREPKPRVPEWYETLRLTAGARWDRVHERFTVLTIAVPERCPMVDPPYLGFAWTGNPGPHWEIRLSADHDLDGPFTQYLVGSAKAEFGWAFLARNP